MTRPVTYRTRLVLVDLSNTHTRCFFLFYMTGLAILQEG